MDADAFWASVAKERIDWISPWKKIREGDFKSKEIKWFLEGKLNISVNCLDRHLPTKADKIALLWEGDDETQTSTLTFKALHQQVCQMANVLKSLNVKKGDCVGICLPMIPAAAIAMLASARIGAVHMVVFAGFSAAALRQRLQDAACKVLITADGYYRGGKPIALKARADEATEGLAIKTLVIQNTKKEGPWNKDKDFWWHILQTQADSFCEPEVMEAEDPLFILYTSGSTGKPKGLVHSSGGYIVQVAYSFQAVFHCSPEDVFWCTADIGWITGHSYLIYGPLCNGITTLIFEGIPTWPDSARYWRLIDKYKVSVFYTAPTVLRLLKQAGESWLKTSSRKSLRLLGSVGEPINPEVWLWFSQQVGLGRCKIVDTWWQTETGAIMISPIFPYLDQKPGAACKPLPFLDFAILDEDGQALEGQSKGSLAIKNPWPSLARTIVGDHARYLQSYFHNGYYITGDGASRDVDNDYWITGRMDDVLNVSGHRLGTAEIESALVAHPLIAEAAVVGIPHAIKGEGIYAFVTVKKEAQITAQLERELMERVATEIGPIAKPDTIRLVLDLPKTRSGKIMRRILKQIARKTVNKLEDLGDISTLANPQVLKALFE